MSALAVRKRRTTLNRRTSKRKLQRKLIWIETKLTALSSPSLFLNMEEHYYDVSNPEGRYIAKIPLKHRPFVLKKNKLYTIEEDEEGYHVVKRYKVMWRIE